MSGVVRPRHSFWEQRVAGSNPAAPTIGAPPCSSTGTDRMPVRIFKQPKNAMQSGMARAKLWTLVFEDDSPREIEPLMGWTSSGDTRQQIRLFFDSKEKPPFKRHAAGSSPAGVARVPLLGGASLHPVPHRISQEKRFRYIAAI